MVADLSVGQKTHTTVKQAEPKKALIDPELETMVRQVKEVLPDTPLEIIIMDLSKCLHFFPSF